jgi:hypothetical protein
MSEPLRDDPRAQTAASPVDRDAKIEQLLIAGLDLYFSGRHERAIHVWTRVLFLDRGHARARAYIERARSALAEQQRESEELLQTGVAALNRGDVNAARDLVTSAVKQGGPQDVAAALHQRMDRLEAGDAASARASSAARARPAARAVPQAPESAASPARSYAMTALVIVALLVGGAFAIDSWDRIQPMLTRQAARPRVVPPPDDPLPVPGGSEIALTRARALVERGRLHEALRLLDQVQVGDRFRREADVLAGAIQRALLSGIDPRAASPGIFEPPR